MQRKLNEDFIKEYSRKFSEKVTSIFFTQKEIITGKEILSVTSSRQVNFFVMKILFRKWQEEMKKLESPYFNYRNSEVRRAMVDFMNVLSQHIEVPENEFTRLLREAVEDTLVVCLAPDLYLRKELDQKEISQVNEKVTKPIYKYLKVYQDQFEIFFKENVGRPHDIFLENAESFFQTPDEQVDRELNALSQILPISLDDLWQTEEELPAEVEETIEPDFPDMEPEVNFPAEESENGSGAFVADESDMWAEDEISEPENAGEDVAESEAVTDSDEEDAIFEREEELPEEEDLQYEEQEDMAGDFPEEHAEVAPEPEEEEMQTEEEPANEPVSEDSPTPAQDGETRESVNETLASGSQPSTINDRFAEADRPTLGDHLQEKKVDSIMEAISVNHRYMFTKELFGGDREEFTRAIEQIESCESFDDAVEMLVQEFAREREWDMNSEEVKELLKVTFRRFR